MPAGFPCGMPGMDEDSEGAMQQAPQPARQSMCSGRSLKKTSFQVR
jgi:hypothetical protein